MDADKHDTHLQIPDWLFTDAGLRPMEACCYSVILSFTVAGKECFLSLSKFAKRLNAADRTILSTLHALENQGLIEKERYKFEGVSRCRYRAKYLKADEFRARNLTDR